ncbi:hypothetical protein Pmani_025976 [Petrolisthes manimaculis]|uniref:Tetratricopeptide repeat protein 27 n=1 Tax=Petrolisthes manimaculis TaxID=1843537 RepID=A0AAE1P4D9_9EUCA|nr:hypothetical protein Pmani_025976 [Petrolisthes manimaculis]
MEANLHKTERKYLYPDYDTGGVEADNEDGVWSVSELVGAGSYVEALQTDQCQEALGKECPGSRTSNTTITNYYQDILTKYLQDSGPDKQHIVLCVGISCLQLFAQNNFTGPLVGPAPHLLLPGLIPEGQSEEEVRKEAMDALVGDAEGVYALLNGPEYLVIARLVLVDLRAILSHCLTTDWWCVRCALLQQRVADERSPQLYQTLLHALNKVENNQQLVSPEVSRDLATLYHLEAGHLHLYYYDVGRAGGHFNTAADILGIEAQLMGALGRRTKWQQEDRPQLVLKVEYKGQPITDGNTPNQAALLPADLPKDIILNDDTRLHRFQFKEEDEDVVPNLRPLDQLVILASITHKRRATAIDLQLDQETKAYLVALLQYPKNWCVQLSSLLLRARVEATEPRAMERSLTQVEELVGAVAREDPSRYERLKLFSASLVPPHWELQQELAKMLLRLGCVKAALEVFERLQLWEDVVTCYNELQMRQRAAEVVRIQLEKGETPKLWCMLGDATDNVDHYHHAWQLSGQRSGRAQRCLGNYYYVRKQYKEAAEHYQISVSINSLQFPVWQRLAYCSLQLEEWEQCAQAYRRCSVLEPDSFEVWNNMSQAYLRLDQKDRAWRALKEALRCNQESWRLWDNFLLVSTSLGHVSDALHAYARVLSLKERHVDTMVLGRLVKTVLEGLEEVKREGGTNLESGVIREALGLYRRCVQILAQLTQQVPTHPELWFLYGTLTRATPEPGTETCHLAMQQFKKAVAATTQKSGWERDTLTTVAALHRADHLLDAAMAAAEVAATPGAAIADLNSVRLTVNSVLVASQRGQANVVTGELVEEVQQPLSIVQEKLATLRLKLDHLKQQIAPPP